MMKYLIMTIAAAVLVSGSATAFELRLVPTTPTRGDLGDLVTWEVYLDTAGESNITLFSASLTFDPYVVQYRPDLSASHSYYPLYAVGIPDGPETGQSKGAFPTYLIPWPFDDGACFGDFSGMCGNNPPRVWGGDQPDIGGQVNVDFIEANLAGTIATATNLLLARLTFEIIDTGVSRGEWGFGYGGNIFSVGLVDIADPSYAGPRSVTATGSPTMGWVPEPSTSLLVASGLLAMAIARRGTKTGCISGE